MRRLFVLDTNVLMHDPASIFRFEEHDIYLPMVVLEELDANKKGLSESSRNVRQVSRFLDEMMRGATKEQIDQGLPLPSGYSGNHGKKASSGRLFFQTRHLGGAAVLPESLPGHGADNAILAQTLAAAARGPRHAGHAGVQGHQPAHQGRGPGRARRGLLQRQDAGGLGCPLPRHDRAAGGLLGRARQ